MKKLLTMSKVVFMAITLFICISCDDDENGNIIDPNNGMSNTIADFVINSPEYSSLLSVLDRTGLLSSLAGNDNFTVFAPDNTAFDAFLNGTSLDDISDEVLTQLVLNHMIGTSISSEQFSTGYLKSLASEASSGASIDLYINTTNGFQLNGQSNVVTADIQTDNGIVHAVDTVIELPTLQTFASSNPDLSSLVTALTDEGNTGFTNMLEDADLDLTVFAPTNTAFDTFLNGTDIGDIDNTVLNQLLSNHFISDTIGISSSLSNSYINTQATFQNDPSTPLSLYINTDAGVLLNGTSNVTQGDIVGINGVIHIVDTVIDLPNLSDFILADPNFSSFVTALTLDNSFSFLDILQIPNGTVPAPFTVFAPTDTAFTDLLTDLNLMEISEVPINTLETTLALHIITGMNIRAEDLAGLDGTNVSTINGGLITIDGTTPAIVDPDGGINEISLSNIQSNNGVLHSINRVIRDL